MDRPLAGVRVLDLGQIYLGGYCGQLLGYLGADVVKVEPPWGENVRSRTEDGYPAQVQLLNAGKRGITLDLKSDEGKETLRELAADADVLVENYSTGTMDALGLGYETLSEVNSRLVYAHGSGYGDAGEYAEYPAMDLTVQAMSGVMHTTGFADGPPVKAGPAVCDFLGATHLALGVVSALYRREATGRGDYVEVAMYDCMYPTLTSPLASLVAERGAPPRTGNRHSGLAIAPYNAYETADGYVTVICVSERHWQGLARVIDRPELAAAEGYDSKAARAERIDEIDAMVGSWVGERSTDDVVETLQAAGVPCAPVQTVEELLRDPHLRDRGMIHDLPNQGAGRETVPVPGMPVKFRASPDAEVTPAPRLGEHTESVLAALGRDAGDDDGDGREV